MSSESELPPFVRLPKLLFLDGTWASLKRREFAVLGALASYINREGEAWPSVGSLGRIGGVVAPWNVRLALKKLEAAGVIRKLEWVSKTRTFKYSLVGLTPFALVPAAEPKVARRAPARREGARPRGSEQRAPVPLTSVLEQEKLNNIPGVVAVSFKEEAEKYGIDEETFAALELAYGLKRIGEVFDAARDGFAAGRIAQPRGWIIAALRKEYDVARPASRPRSHYRPLSPEARAGYDKQISEVSERARSERAEQEAGRLVLVQLMAALPADVFERVRAEVLASAEPAIGRLLAKVDARRCDSPMALGLAGLIRGRLGKDGA